MVAVNSYCDIKRGDVYYVRADRGVGSEMASGRPVVVVSDETLEKVFPIFTCVYMTTSNRSKDATTVELFTPTRKSWALCNQVYSFDETRLLNHMCTLTDDEMRRIEEALALNLKLNVECADEKDALIEKYEAEIAALKAAHEKELAAAKNEAVGMIVDYELCKRKYECAMEKLASMLMGRDLENRSAAPEPVVVEPVVVKEPEPEPEPEEPRVVDINRCSLGDLVSLGFSMNTAKMIQAARPYNDVDELRGVPGVTRIGYQFVENRIAVGEPVEKEKKKPAAKKKPVVKEKPPVEEVPVEAKVNVNQATATEIRKATGMSARSANGIVRYRKSVGAYKSVEDLLNCPDFGKTCMKRYGDMLTVG